MNEATPMMLGFAGLMTVASLAWIALAMDAHWQQVHGGSAPRRSLKFILRMLGIAGLLVSAVLCFLADHPSVAALVWLMLLAAATPMIALALALQPGLLRGLWPWH